MAGEPRDANGLVFLGTATLVSGARPDVQASFPTRPANEKAGWGYMLLTNMLPGGGNGVFTLHAFARDLDGHSALLGSRTITVTNASAQLPFGTIDTPRQGETVSGTIYNFGWALTPLPNTIPFDGSTIGVYVDGVLPGSSRVQQSPKRYPGVVSRIQQHAGRRRLFPAGHDFACERCAYDCMGCHRRPRQCPRHRQSILHRQQSLNAFTAGLQPSGAARAARRSAGNLVPCLWACSPVRVHRPVPD